MLADEQHVQKLFFLILMGLEPANYERSIKMGWEITVDKEKCTGCEECVNNCPAEVLTLVDEKSGPKSEPTNADECLGCETCVEVCEADAITVNET